MEKAYIFDMDGVLCDSEAFIAEAAQRMFRETYGVDVALDDFTPFVGTGEDRYLGGVAEKYGVTLTLPRDKDVTYRLYADVVPGRLQPLPGVVAFIQRACDAGIRCAVATSADPFKMKVNLDAIGLDASCFGALVTGADIERKKPHPDIFLKAADLLSVSPVSCRVFEDALNGVQAAKAAGMHCVGISSFFSEKALRDAGADDVWPDFLAASDQ